MTQETAIWFKGLLAALIGGAAGAIASGPVAGMIDPEHFNLTSGGLGHLLVLMGCVALISAISHTAFYLKQSPLPGFNADGQLQQQQQSQAKAAGSDGK